MAPGSPDDRPTADGSGTLAATSPSDHSLGEPPAKKQKTSTEPQATGRRQAACQTCRLRKVKCDKKRPRCALCNASGALCEYLGEPTERLSLESATSTILERIDQLREELHSVKQAGATQPQALSSRQPEPLSSPYQKEPPSVTHHHQLPPPPRPVSSHRTTFEPSRDFLRIPPHRASADTILQWEVFEQRYPPNALIGVLFGPDQSPGVRPPDSPSSDLIASPTGIRPPDEEQIPSLIDRFLQNVHTKNPILDVESLVKHGRRCADHGVGWDGWSCLVLLACALGSVAKPFGMMSRRASRPAESSARMYAKELQQGDSCFTLACRRLGSLKYSMLGAQCYFFAGVYLMYTLRPIQSWHYFLQASIFCQFYLRMTHGISDSFAEVLRAPSQALSSHDRKARRLEQSLYWSCFKSECEFRVELPLPQSEISLGEYPNLFPTPPEPIPTQDQQYPSLGSRTSVAEEELELRQHAMRLCNEEESWYYYLTEIALRRIGNRIINTFFPRSENADGSCSRASWLNVRPLLRMAREFEAQVSSWSAHLPPAMQQYETSSIIRAPHLSFRDGESNGRAGEEEDIDSRNGSHVSRELSWAIDNRLLEMQTWLYQPFLYYLVHSSRMLPPPPPLRTPTSESGLPYPNHGPPSTPGLDSRQCIDNLLNPFSPTQSHSAAIAVDYITSTTSTIPVTSPTSRASTSGSLDTTELATLQSLITSGIECSLKTIEVRARGHRHHGLWYDLRSTMSASLILLAIVKSGHAAWIPGGTETLWGRGAASTPGGTSNETGGRRGAVPIGGMIAKVMGQFEFWAAEAPDMMRYRDVLETVVRDVRGS